MAGSVRRGKAFLGEFRQGRQGVVRHGEERKGKPRQAWLGRAWRGEARRCEAGDKKEVFALTYKWKLPGVIPVDAQTAGDELERIYHERGELNPADIVEESRNEDAPLHRCFEWDDQTAAEKYRESQASLIIRSIVTVADGRDEPQEVRAYVHVENTYRPVSVVVESRDYMEELLKTALLELAAFQRKYNALSSLRPVFEAIEKVSA